MKWKIALIAIVAVLVALRAILPAVMLNQANAFLADYSKIVSARIGDIDISIIRMAYRFEGIEVKLRKDDYRILYVGAVDVSLAWRELLRARILTDIDVKDARINAHPGVTEALTALNAENARKSEAETKEKTETVQSKFFPLRIERISVEGSSLQYAAEKNSPEEKRLILDQTQMRISNINPTKPGAMTVATFESRLMRNAELKGVAQSRTRDDRRDWDVDAEMRGFNLIHANPFLLDLVPFTFTAGKLDMFAEVKSEDGALIGYVKPFMTDADILERSEKFKGAKHFFTEIGAAFGNILMKRPKYKSVATKLDFTKAGPGAEFKIDTLGAIANAVEHRLGDPIAPSVEDEIVLK